MPTLSEVDEALRHLSAVPKDRRGAAWYAYADAVLTEREIAKLMGEVDEQG